MTPVVVAFLTAYAWASLFVALGIDGRVKRRVQVPVTLRVLFGAWFVVCWPVVGAALVGLRAGAWIDDGMSA